MSVSFDIRTYDILQRTVSTAEALHELGSGKVAAAHEAAESVLDDENHQFHERAYVIEWITANGPKVDIDIINAQLNDPDTMDEYVEQLELAVLGAAAHSEAFDQPVDSILETSKEPQDTYSTNPDKVLELFEVTARVKVEEEGMTPSEASAAAVSEYEQKLSQLSFTALCVVIDHLRDEYDLRPENTQLGELEPAELLNGVGVGFFEEILEERVEEYA